MKDNINSHQKFILHLLVVKGIK